MPEIRTEQDPGVIFALDIGTRSIIGMLGRAEEGRFHVSAIEKEGHGRRAMLDGRIVEMVEIPDHPWYIATQAHPELKSRPNRPHPLFKGFVEAAVKMKGQHGDI